MFQSVWMISKVYGELFELFGMALECDRRVLSLV